MFQLKQLSLVGGTGKLRRSYREETLSKRLNIPFCIINPISYSKEKNKGEGVGPEEPCRQCRAGYGHGHP